MAATLNRILRTIFTSLFSAMHHTPGLRVHQEQGVALLEARNRDGSNERLSLREFIASRCPSLLESFSPAWWLFNGHLQTFYCVSADFSKIDQVVYDRKYLRLRDGGTIGVDFTPSSEDNSSFDDETPVVVVTHGLTGGSHESYVRNILAPACTPIDQGGLGYRGVVLNFRGCAGTPITSPQFYSAYHTDDLRQVLIYLSTLYPKAPFIGIGFSLGASVITRYVAEEGANSRLKSACALGCPWNLWKNNERLEDGWFYQNIYSRTLGQNLVRAFVRHADTLEKQWPDHPVTKAVNTIRSMEKNPKLAVFDDTVTKIAGGSPAPHGPFPFSSGHEYYVTASTDHVLPSIGVPFLAINAGDDPVVRTLPEEGGKNPLIALVTTAGGGHLGWFESNGVLGAKRWITRPVLEWLKATAEDLVLPERSLPRIIEDSDEWITEEGREHLGVKLEEGMDRVVGTEGQEGIIQGL